MNLQNSIANEKVTNIPIWGAIATITMILVAAFSPELYDRVDVPGAEAALTTVIATFAAWYKTEHG